MSLNSSLISIQRERFVDHRLLTYTAHPRSFQTLLVGTPSLRQIDGKNGSNITKKKMVVGTAYAGHSGSLMGSVVVSDQFYL